MDGQLPKKTSKLMNSNQIGIKKEATEVKLLIHDLRVKRFIDDIIHLHATLDTDLEIHNIEKEHKIHGRDLQELKLLTGAMRKAYNHYRTAIKETSTYGDIVSAGRFYIEKIREICELILNPLWGRFDRIISLLPQESKSYRSWSDYCNHLRWICGVYYRIEQFIQETETHELYEEFDVADSIYEFTNNVIYGYVEARSPSKIKILFENVESAVIGGNKPRYRRMYFNLVKNAVDAMLGKQDGTLVIRVQKSDGHVYLQVKDNGTGMTPAEIEEVLTQKKDLHEELESIGFAFVRQTVQEFGGRLSIDSGPGNGTTVTIGVPYLYGKGKPKAPRSKCERYFHFILGYPQTKPNITVIENARKINISELWKSRIASKKDRTEERYTVTEHTTLDRDKYCGETIYNDYKISQAQFPGCLFAISVNYQNLLDFFCHRPYEKHFNINHEDLNPILFESTVRGRLEENEDHSPEITLKSPCSVHEFFEFKNVSEKERCACKFKQMMHDEYILIARKLVNSGLPPTCTVQASNMRQYFTDFDSVFKRESFSIFLLAEQKLTIETS